MTLNAYAAQLRLRLFDDLKAGANPSEGDFDAALLGEARLKGHPQLGTTRFEPESIIIEFIFSNPQGAAIIVPVRVSSPERIVFLPVPEWVIESIWQGDVDGSYHFESHARALVAGFSRQLEPEANLKWFGPQPAKRRE